MSQESTSTLIEEIKVKNKELSIYEKEREEINNLKVDKDNLIFTYVNSTKQPTRLLIDIINYKALLFYFIEKFINESDNPLSYENYTNSLEDKEIFKNYFGEKEKILIKTKYTNFPHLIGYKKAEEGESYKKDNKSFLKSIFYETDLIKDYRTHGCQKDKLDTFSWIWNTLNKPSFVYSSNGIAEECKLEADLVFISKRSKIDYARNLKKITYHYVSLKLINKETNIYVINSHHPMTSHNYKMQFKNEGMIYKRY